MEFVIFAEDWLHLSNSSTLDCIRFAQSLHRYTFYINLLTHYNTYRSNHERYFQVFCFGFYAAWFVDFLHKRK